VGRDTGGPPPTARGPRAQPRNVIRIEHSQFSNHKAAGRSEFGPDGLAVYRRGRAAAARATRTNTGQNLGTLLGKIPADRSAPWRGGFRIPSGNPFTGGAGGAARSTHYGFRNPWRLLVIDRSTGALAGGRRGAGRGSEEMRLRARRARLRRAQLRLEPLRGQPPLQGGSDSVVTRRPCWCAPTPATASARSPAGTCVRDHLEQPLRPLTCMATCATRASTR
jgi:hypothetical protein